jgi:hypothetical protein
MMYAAIMLLGLSTPHQAVTTSHSVGCLPLWVVNVSTGVQDALYTFRRFATADMMEA